VASAVGRKLPPTLFVKGGNDLPIQTQNGVLILSSEKAWMNEDVFIKWIQFMFPFVAPNTILLVFDLARPHISKRAKANLHARGILFVVIPGGLTGLLQPCDVLWFRPLKLHLSKEIDAWKACNNHSFTRVGNPRPPTLADMTRWFFNSWNHIENTLITDSFHHWFLYDVLFLHIAKHEVYGPSFRLRMVLLLSVSENVEGEDESRESGPDEIIDE
jgi:hypothetical protein